MLYQLSVVTGTSKRKIGTPCGYVECSRWLEILTKIFPNEMFWMQIIKPEEKLYIPCYLMGQEPVIVVI